MVQSKEKKAQSKVLYENVSLIANLPNYIDYSSKSHVVFGYQKPKLFRISEFYLIIET